VGEKAIVLAKAAWVRERNQRFKTGEKSRIGLLKARMGLELEVI
jgi:hypothetical protein